MCSLFYETQGKVGFKPLIVVLKKIMVQAVKERS